MRIPFSWLAEFTPISEKPLAVAEKLREVGVPVVHVESSNSNIQGIVAGKILTLTIHPNADKLSIAEVDLGGKTAQIITGATNVSQGDMVPVAALGATLADGKIIQQAKLRGILSDGMMCSANELGLAFLKDFLPKEQQEGILLLPSQTPAGANVVSLLELGEAVLVLEPFANRPDYFSVFGIAREAAALYNLPLKLPELHPPGKASLKDKIQVSILEPQGCQRYIARYVSNVKIAPSHLGIALRLARAGIKPINNIVDVTNYVLLELGQPLHAFDYNKITQKIIQIRHAKKGEKLLGIDEKTYELSEKDLVIADGQKPVALAGIMGGKESEISLSTTTVLLESAHFDPRLIRRTSLKLGVRTESSRRFEKGLDLISPDWGSRRACALFSQMGITVSEEVTDAHEKFPETQEISVRLNQVKKILGIGELEENEIHRILAGLGFDVKNHQPLLVKAPPLRTDVHEEVDIIEEIARHHQYNKIPATLPALKMAYAALDPNEEFEEKARDALSHLGLMEVVNYALGDPLYFQKFSGTPLALIQNPLTEDRRALRNFLYPSMLLNLKKNFSTKTNDLGFFEIGRVFENNHPLGEKRHCAIVLTGNLPWEKAASFFTLKGMLEEIWEMLHIQEPFQLEKETRAEFHPHRLARIVSKGQEIGILGELHPAFLFSLEIEQEVFLLELALDKLQSLEEQVQFKLLPVYPESRRDISMIVDEKAAAGKIVQTIQATGGELVEKVHVFDLYQGPQIPKGKKSIALAIIYRASDRTLTEQEVNALHEKIQAKLKQSFDATLRIV